MFVLLLATAALGASGDPVECGDGRAPEELDAALEGVEAAWGVDESAFTAGMAAVREAFTCLRAPVAPALAARYHRAEGLSAFLARDTRGAGRAFAAARALEPDYRFPAAMVPAGNPVEVAWAAASADGSTRPAPPPAGGDVVWFDGHDDRARPVGRPAVYQLQAGDGAVLATSWLPADAPLPYRARGEGLRLPLLIGAGVAGAAAGGLYAWAGAAHAEWETADTEDAVVASRGRTNTLVAASGGAAVVAVGLGATAFLVGRW